MATTEDRHGISFATDAAPSASDELTRPVQAPLIIRRVEVVFYGAQNLLTLDPFIELPRGEVLPLVEAVGKAEIDGDMDHFEFHTDVAATEGDTIVVAYSNNDTTDPHAFRVNMDIERPTDEMSNIFDLGGIR